MKTETVQPKKKPFKHAKATGSTDPRFPVLAVASEEAEARFFAGEVHRDAFGTEETWAGIVFYERGFFGVVWFEAQETWVPSASRSPRPAVRRVRDLKKWSVDDNGLEAQETHLMKKWRSE